MLTSSARSAASDGESSALAPAPSVELGPKHFTAAEHAPSCFARKEPRRTSPLRVARRTIANAPRPSSSCTVHTWPNGSGCASDRSSTSASCCSKRSAGFFGPRIASSVDIAAVVDSASSAACSAANGAASLSSRGLENRLSRSERASGGSARGAAQHHHSMSRRRARCPRRKGRLARLVHGRGRPRARLFSDDSLADLTHSRSLTPLAPSLQLGRMLGRACAQPRRTAAGSRAPSRRRRMARCRR